MVEFLGRSIFTVSMYSPLGGLRDIFYIVWWRVGGVEGLLWRRREDVRTSARRDVDETVGPFWDVHQTSTTTMAFSRLVDTSH